MANMYNYTFNNMTRLGEDNCTISEKDIQNNNFGTYSTQNYFERYCGMQQPISVATSQPSMFYNGGGGGSAMSGVGGCNIDDNSDLTIGSIYTNTKAKLNLQQRNLKPIHNHLSLIPSPTLQVIGLK